MLIQRADRRLVYRGKELKRERIEGIEACKKKNRLLRKGRLRMGKRKVIKEKENLVTKWGSTFNPGQCLPGKMIFLSPASICHKVMKLESLRGCWYVFVL